MAKHAFTLDLIRIVLWQWRQEKEYGLTISVNIPFCNGFRFHCYFHCWLPMKGGYHKIVVLSAPPFIKWLPSLLPLNNSFYASKKWDIVKRKWLSCNHVAHSWCQKGYLRDQARRHHLQMINTAPETPSYRL